MPTMNDWLSAFPIRNPRDILRQLAEYAEKYGTRKTNPIRVSLLLSSGQTLKGTIGRYGAHDQMEYVLLSLGDSTDAGVAYVQLNQVAALEIHDFAAAAAMLETADARARSGPPLSRLQTKREFEALNQELYAKGLALSIDCAWDAIGATEDEFYGLADLSSALKKVLMNLVEDALGADALKKISALQIRSEAGHPLRIERKDAALILTCDLQKPLMLNLEGEVKRQLEAAL